MTVGRVLVVASLALTACGLYEPGLVLNDTPGRKIIPGQPPQAPPGLPAPIQPPASSTPAEEECARLAGPRRSIEASTLRVRATILGDHNGNALISGNSRQDQVVRVGEYIGTHCWRVNHLEMDSISIEMAPHGGSAQHTARIHVDDRPHSELAGLK